MSPDMEPGPARPGITICTPQGPGNPHSMRWSSGQPQAAYWCRCGESSRATGVNQVLALIDRWADHCEACTLAPEPRRRQADRQASAVPGRSADRRHQSEPATTDGLWAA